MLEVRGRAGFALEPLDELRVEGEGKRQHLDRHLALEVPVLGPEHQRHAAAPELLQDFVLCVECFPDHIELRHRP